MKAYLELSLPKLPKNRNISKQFMCIKPQFQRKFVYGLGEVMNRNNQNIYLYFKCFKMILVCVQKLFLYKFYWWNIGIYSVFQKFVKSHFLTKKSSFLLIGFAYLICPLLNPVIISCVPQKFVKFLVF